MDLSVIAIFLLGIQLGQILAVWSLYRMFELAEQQEDHDRP